VRYFATLFSQSLALAASVRLIALQIFFSSGFTTICNDNLPIETLSECFLRLLTARKKVMFDFYSTTTFFPEATSSAKYRRMKIFRGRVWNEQEVQALISVVYIMEWLKVQHRFFF